MAFVLAHFHVPFAKLDFTIPTRLLVPPQVVVVREFIFHAGAGEWRHANLDI